MAHSVRRPALIRPELPHQPADLFRSHRVLAFNEGVVWFELLEQGGGFERRDDVWLRGLDRHMPLDGPVRTHWYVRPCRRQSGLIVRCALFAVL
jgi:hypothetical protein